MDLFINICLVFFGAVGAAVALRGETWIITANRWHKRLSFQGWIAAIFLSLSAIFGVIKEVRTDRVATRSAAEQERLRVELDRFSEQKRSLESQLLELKQQNRSLQEQNLVLQNTSLNVQSLLNKQERLDAIAVRVDAFDADERRGFNTLDRLAEKVSGNEKLGWPAIGIELLAKYGALEIYISGVRKNEKEDWFAKVFFSDVDRKDFFQTDPIAFEKGQAFLLNLKLDDSRLREFWLQSPRVASMLARSEYVAEVFDPGFELGVFKILRFGQLDDSVDSFAFAKRLATAPIRQELAVPIRFVSDWHVTLTVNNREITSLGNRKGFTSLREQLDRLERWQINPKYRRPGDIWLAPIPGQWREYFPLMNANVRELLYGQRDGLIQVDPKALPPMSGPK